MYQSELLGKLITLASLIIQFKLHTQLSIDAHISFAFSNGTVHSFFKHIFTNKHLSAQQSVRLSSVTMLQSDGFDHS